MENTLNHACDVAFEQNFNRRSCWNQARSAAEHQTRTSFEINLLGITYITLLCLTKQLLSSTNQQFSTHVFKFYQARTCLKARENRPCCIQQLGHNTNGPKIELCPFGEAEMGPHLTQWGQGRRLPPYATVHLDPASRLVTTDME